MPKIVKNIPKEAARLKEFRKHIGLKQEEMALLLDLKQGSYSDIERGKILLNTKHIKTLMKAHFFNPIWFLTGKGEMKLDLTKAKTMEKKEVIKKDESTPLDSQELVKLKMDNQKYLVQIHSLERENKTLQRLVDALERQLED